MTIFNSQIEHIVLSQDHYNFTIEKSHNDRLQDYLFCINCIFYERSIHTRAIVQTRASYQCREFRGSGRIFLCYSEKRLLHDLQEKTFHRLSERFVSDNTEKMIDWLDVWAFPHKSWIMEWNLSLEGFSFTLIDANLMIFYEIY